MRAPVRVASAATAGASFSSARLIGSARFIVVRSGTSEYGSFSVGMLNADIVLRKPPRTVGRGLALSVIAGAPESVVEQAVTVPRTVGVSIIGRVVDPLQCSH
jgi:hypothetical protein